LLDNSLGGHTIQGEINPTTTIYLLYIYLAAAGGMLGLLLGASALTLVEFLDFLIKLFRMKWSETKVTTIN
jgi:hypothetical protein